MGTNKILKECEYFVKEKLKKKRRMRVLKLRLEREQIAFSSITAKNPKNANNSQRRAIILINDIHIHKQQALSLSLSLSLSLTRQTNMVARLSFTLIFLAFFTLHSHSQQTPAAPILYDIYPFIRVYKNGTIQRFIGQEITPPSTDPATGVRSKDVHFSNLAARLYLPKTAAAKLPLLIYFHGGGFFTESAFSPTYHHHLISLVATAHIVAVSVNYRLAPEHPLPAAYEDSWLALKWTLSHYADPWLKTYADLGKIYLGGDSAGANIAQRMAVRVGLEGPGRGVNLQGMFLNCPFFLGKKVIGNESGDVYAETQMRKLWLYAYPNSTGLDDPLVNPGMDPGLGRVGCRRVLVYVAGNDVLRFRGKYYAAALGRSGWKGEVKVVEVEGENHVFNLINPNSPKAVAMLRVLASFLNHS